MANLYSACYLSWVDSSAGPGIARASTPRTLPTRYRLVKRKRWNRIGSFYWILDKAATLGFFGLWPLLCLSNWRHVPQIYRHLWPSSQGPVGRTYRVYIYQCLVVYFHYRMRHCREGREHFQNNARCKTNKYVTCFLSTRAKVTRTLGLVRATFPVSDKNARLLKAASLFKWPDITVVRAEKKNNGEN